MNTITIIVKHLYYRYLVWYYTRQDTVENFVNLVKLLGVYENKPLNDHYYAAAHLPLQLHSKYLKYFLLYILNLTQHFKNGSEQFRGLIHPKEVVPAVMFFSNGGLDEIVSFDKLGDLKKLSLVFASEVEKLAEDDRRELGRYIEIVRHDITSILEFMFYL